MSGNDQNALFVVGLTGGIGSGKSSVAATLSSLGACIVDVDEISHALTAKNGAALPAIGAAFPGAVQGGALERSQLRELVFSDADKRRTLEAILHPMIREQTLLRLTSDEASRSPYVVLVVPLLFESSHYASMIDCALVVDIDESQQIARVSTSRNVPEATVAKIIAAQMNRQDRLRHAQFIIDNRGDEQNLQLQSQRLHTVFVANAAAKKAARVTAVSAELAS
jgi:dephospho-CoA kinase